MLAQFEAHIDREFSFLKDAKLLLACSGGLDSVVLFHLCKALQFNFAVAHCNFKLRGKESDDDAAFVQMLAGQHKITCFQKSFDVSEETKKANISTQMAARNLRYQWFDALKGEKGFDYILTAHHSDDSVETFLINLSRGTGLSGLKGVPAQNRFIVRPLLPFSKEIILAYAKSEQIDWREDSSNHESKYLRNQIRHEVVPKLKELHPKFLDNFLSTQQKLLGSLAILDNTKKQLQADIFKVEGDIIKISIAALNELEPLQAYMHLLFSDFGFTEWNDIANLVKASSGKQIASKTHVLVKDRAYLLLSKLVANNDAEAYMIYEKEYSLSVPLKLQIAKVDSAKKGSANVLYVDKETLNYPLKLRKWENGDYFYPLGMQGKKKLSKYFKDEKIDILSKKSQWILCSGDEIVWVIGRRADRRFQVTPKTKQILKFELTE